ncbi:hypothetical protein PL75_11510, partial [Neisseria arctica]
AQQYAARSRLDAHAIVGFTHSQVTLFDHPDTLLKLGRGGILSLLDSLPAARPPFTEPLLFGLSAPISRTPDHVPTVLL